MQGWGINHVENIMGFKKNVDTFYELLTTGDGHTIHNKNVLVGIMIGTSRWKKRLGKPLIFLFGRCFHISTTLKKVATYSQYPTINKRFRGGFRRGGLGGYPPPSIELLLFSNLEHLSLPVKL